MRAQKQQCNLMFAGRIEPKKFVVTMDCSQTISVRAHSPEDAAVEAARKFGTAANYFSDGNKWDIAVVDCATGRGITLRGILTHAAPYLSDLQDARKPFSERSFA